MGDTSEELFRTDDLRVSRVARHGGPCCVVTFDSFAETGALDRPGYGEAFLDQSGIDALHVVGGGNDWYQYADMHAAMAAVRAATRSYARVVTYGSSMGGYAAVRLAGLAGACAALALSPQFSISRRVVPWERRWRESSLRFEDAWESALPLPALPEAYVVYDPKTPDRRHAALLRAGFACTAIELPGIGHPVTGFLAEIGLLQEAILGVCAGDFDPGGFARAAMERRMQSAQYLVGRARSDWRLRRGGRIALMREAVRLAPDNAMASCRLGQELTRAGRFGEALAMHRRALEIAPGHRYFAWALSVSLEASGDSDLALATMEQAASGPDAPVRYRTRLAALRARAAGREKPGA